MADVEIYTQPFCPYCSRAMSLFEQKGVVFKEIHAPGGSTARAEAQKRSGGKTSVPQIFINDTLIGGCDDMMALEHAGRLDALLER